MHYQIMSSDDLLAPRLAEGDAMRVIGHPLRLRGVIEVRVPLEE